MCEMTLQAIYFLFVHVSGRRLTALESYINYVDGEMVFSDDLLRNEPDMYGDLFSSGCKGYLHDLFGELLAELKLLRFEESEAVLDGLEFVQNVGATALWKFNCNLSPDMEDFVRGFDRLDTVEDRKRLYLLAQI